MRSQHRGQGRSTLGRKVFGRGVAASAGSPRSEAAARACKNARSAGCVSQARFTASQRGASAGAGALTRLATNLATSRLKTTAKGTSSGAGTPLASFAKRGRLAAGDSWTWGGCSGPACNQCQKAQRRRVSSNGPMTSGKRKQTPRPAAASSANPAARASSASNFPSPYESARCKRVLVFASAGRAEADSCTKAELEPSACETQPSPAHELTS
mmetsp:Transcript_15546/g.32398  ORF Transcript_15546/g.32398 Transcript_15546/m.32398 type:complete len:213 (-) Transcript_15546:410-1048(-)